MAAPSMTFNAAGNIRTSASLAAVTAATYNVDYSTKIEGQITVKSTGGGTVNATNGCRVQILPRYGSTLADSSIPAVSYIIPTIASTTASKTLFVSTGKYVINVYNLDPSNAITVEVTDATVDGIA